MFEEGDAGRRVTPAEECTIGRGQLQGFAELAGRDLSPARQTTRPSSSAAASL